MKFAGSSTHKKVVVETFAGERVLGYVNPRHFDRESGLELLDAAGQMKEVAWKEVKVAWFVRDWQEPLARPDRAVFLRKPRLEGLWIRLRFRDDEVLEGMLVNDLLHLSRHGYLITPPDLNGSHQKAFVPRAALASMEVLSVIPNRGEHHRRRRSRKFGAPEPERQPRLFES